MKYRIDFIRSYDCRVNRDGYWNGDIGEPAYETNERRAIKAARIFADQSACHHGAIVSLIQDGKRIELVSFKI